MMRRLSLLLLCLVGCAELDTEADVDGGAWAQGDGGGVQLDDGSMLVMEEGTEVSPMGDMDGEDASADAAGEQAMEEPPDMNPEPTDAGAPEPDAGPPVADGPVTLDGILTGAEWDGAAMVSTDTATDWGPGQNELTELRARIIDGDLVLAVTGRVETMNAIVLYVDSLPGKGIPSPSAISDATGALDVALDNVLSVPADFEADYAWGTRSMSGPSEAEAGWRRFDDPTDLGWIPPSEAPTSCSSSACETLIPITSLGATPGGSVRIFARITNADGDDFANQTLPPDNPSNPSDVSQLWTVTL